MNHWLYTNRYRFPVYGVFSLTTTVIAARPTDPAKKPVRKKIKATPMAVGVALYQGQW